VLAVVFGVSGCGGSSHAATLLSGQLANIPEYPSSHSFGPQHVNGAVTTRSFGTDDAKPNEILDWYAKHLTGWTEITRPTRRGRTDEVGKWSRDGRWLQVSSAPAPAAGGSQYSLVVASSEAALP
jgi:hypothetical protein